MWRSMKTGTLELLALDRKRRSESDLHGGNSCGGAEDTIVSGRQQTSGLSAPEENEGHSNCSKHRAAKNEGVKLHANTYC